MAHIAANLIDMQALLLYKAIQQDIQNMGDTTINRESGSRSRSI